MRRFLVALLMMLLGAPLKAAIVCNGTWTDVARGRALPVRVRMPQHGSKLPLILFSHGLGGNLDSGTDWTSAWADAGFATITIQHPGSDRAVFRTGLANAMSPEQLAARASDIRFVLDVAGQGKHVGRCDLRRLDLTRIGMSGHSMGAMATLAVIGQHYPLPMLHNLADPRIKAAIAFSPYPPFRNRDDTAAYSGITMPFMTVTGTADVVQITPGVAAADRQRPFRAAPPGDKYLLVLKGANHMHFNGQDNLRNGAPMDPHVRSVTIDATIAFWKSTLLGDKSAQRWLTNGGLRSRLAPGDSFESR